MIESSQFPAVVQKVVPNGKHGPYAKARSDQLGSVTFSLDPKIWQEEEWPDEGACVILMDVRKKRAGWRAQKCRFERPEDATATQQPQTGDSRHG